MQRGHPREPDPPRPYHAKWVVILAVANAAVFLLYMPPFLHFISDGNYAGLIPYMLELFHDGGYPEWALYHPESPTIFHLVSHQFAHAGLFHLGSNLAVLLYVGRPAEHRCRSYLLVVYFLGGAAGAVAHGMWDTAPLLGSSGGVSAVLGSYLVFYFRNGVIRAVIFWLLLYNVVPLFLAVDNISYAAHIGGFAAGIILGAVYAAATRRRAARA